MSNDKINKRKFDFLLFENYHLAKHHIFDLILIARMLKDQGMNVAIVDIYDEEERNEIEGIPVLKIKINHKRPNDTWQTSSRNKIQSLYCKLRFLWQQHNYFKEAINAITPLADKFYCGSYHLLMPISLTKIPKPCYFWGLRSSRMKNLKSKLLHMPIEAIQMVRLKKSFLKNTNCHLFVSNEIIRQEFIDLGISNKRLVLREERCIEKIDDAKITKLDTKPSFLVIGQLREEKNIPFTIEAFRKANIPDANLYLIGRSRGQYENIIQKAIDNDEHIKRKNEFLEYKDFNQYITQSHFVLFADQEEESSITNGTMMEALIQHRPIICPDHNPYKYYINNYNIGLLYKTNDKESYASAMKKAIELGVEHFIPKINLFLNTITYEKISKGLYNNICRNNTKR